MIIFIVKIKYDLFHEKLFYVEIKLQLFLKFDFKMYLFFLNNKL